MKKHNYFLTLTATIAFLPLVMTACTDARQNKIQSGISSQSSTSSADLTSKKLNISRAEVEHLVNQVYLLILERPAEAAGLTYWSDRLEAGLDFQTFLNGFVYSAEFIGRHAIQSDREYIRFAYITVLNREPEQGGWDYWVAQLKGGMNRAEAYKNVLLSEESKNLHPFLRANLIYTPEVPVGGPDLDIFGRVIPVLTMEQMVAAAQIGQNCEHIGGMRMPGTGGGPCGSHQISDANCSAGMTDGIDAAWQSDMGTFGFTAGNSMRFALPNRNVMVFKYRMPVQGEIGPNGLPIQLPKYAGAVWEEQYNRGPLTPTFVSLSQKRCDFDYKKFNAGNPCYKSTGLGGGIGGIIANANQTVDPSMCKLEPNKTYYLSIRWEDPTPRRDRGDGIYVGGNEGKDSCQSIWNAIADNTPLRGYCGMTFQSHF